MLDPGQRERGSERIGSRERSCSGHFFCRICSACPLLPIKEQVKTGPHLLKPEFRSSSFSNERPRRHASTQAGFRLGEPYWGWPGRWIVLGRLRPAPGVYTFSTADRASKRRLSMRLPRSGVRRLVAACAHRSAAEQGGLPPLVLETPGEHGRKPVRGIPGSKLPGPASRAIPRAATSRRTPDRGCLVKVPQLATASEPDKCINSRGGLQPAPRWIWR